VNSGRAAQPDSEATYSRRSSLAIGAGLLGSAIGLRGIVNGAPSSAQGQANAAQAVDTYFAWKSFHLSYEETKERWGHPGGWLLSGLWISANADERLRVELWDPHASIVVPLLWHELAMEADKEVSIITGCTVGEPYLVRICVAAGPGEPSVPVAGCVMPTATRPPPRETRAEQWGGDPTSLDSSWIDMGGSATKSSLSTPVEISWASWNGAGTDEVLQIAFEYPGIGPQGMSVAVQWDEHQKALRTRPIQEWPNATWMWFIRRALAD